MRIHGRGWTGDAPPEFGKDANILQTKRLYLDNARNLEALEIGGSVIWIFQSSGATANVDVRINDQLRGPLNFRDGMFIRGVPFSRLYLTHAAQAGQWLDMLFAVDASQMIDIRNPSAALDEIDVTKSSVYETVADVTCNAAATTQVLAANANRRSAYITNLTGNASILRIGDTNAGATRGTELTSGATIIISTTEAIYAYNPGANQDVGISWTED